MQLSRLQTAEAPLAGEYQKVAMACSGSTSSAWQAFPGALTIPVDVAATATAPDPQPVKLPMPARAKCFSGSSTPLEHFGSLSEAAGFGSPTRQGFSSPAKATHFVSPARAADFPSPVSVAGFAPPAKAADFTSPVKVAAEHTPQPHATPAFAASPISLAAALASEASPVAVAVAATPPAPERKAVVSLANELARSRATSAASPALAAAKSPSQFPPGLPPPEGTPSHGSTLHRIGGCRPCAWFWKAEGCKSGLDCTHCHLCPEGEMKLRRKMKQSMLRARRAICAAGDRFGACEASEADGMPLDTLAGQSDEESTASPASEREVALSSEQVSEKDGETDDGDNEEEEEEVADADTLGEDHAAPSFDLSNRGSTVHGAGPCKPCAWFWKPVGCQRGTSCDFCHLCPPGELKARKKAKHALMRLGVWAEGSHPTDKVSVNLAKFL